jgi:hypothetical protein
MNMRFYFARRSPCGEYRPSPLALRVAVALRWLQWKTLANFAVHLTPAAWPMPGVCLMVRNAASVMRRSFSPLIETLEPRELLNATPAQLAAQLYTDILCRPADSAGLAYWSSQLAGGTPAATVARALLDSSESLDKFVNSRFQAVLGRPADSGALSFFTSYLQTGGATAWLDAAL